MKSVFAFILVLLNAAVSSSQENLFETFPIIKIERSQGICFPQVDQIELITIGDSTLARTYFYQRTSHIRILRKDSLEILINMEQKDIATKFIATAKSEANYYQKVGLDSAEEHCPYYQVILWNSKDISRATINSTGLRYPYKGPKKGELQMLFRGTDRLNPLTFEKLDSCFFGDLYQARERQQNDLEDTLHLLLRDSWLVEGISRKPAPGDTITLTRTMNIGKEYYWQFDSGITFKSIGKSKLDLQSSSSYSIDGKNNPTVLHVKAGFITNKQGAREVANSGITFGVVDFNKSQITLVIWDLN